MRLTISRTTDSLDELTRADGANPPRLGPEPAGVFVAEQEGLGSAAAIGILRGSKQSDLPARGHGALEVAEANQDPQRGHERRDVPSCEGAFRGTSGPHCHPVIGLGGVVKAKEERPHDLRHIKRVVERSEHVGGDALCHDSLA